MIIAKLVFLVACCVAITAGLWKSCTYFQPDSLWGGTLQLEELELILLWTWTELNLESNLNFYFFLLELWMEAKFLFSWNHTLWSKLNFYYSELELYSVWNGIFRALCHNSPAHRQRVSRGRKIPQPQVLYEVLRLHRQQAPGIRVPLQDFLRQRLVQ